MDTPMPPIVGSDLAVGTDSPPVAQHPAPASLGPAPSGGPAVAGLATSTAAESTELLVSHDPGAAEGGGGMSGTLMQMAPLFAVFAIIYFLILRPQQQEQKKHQALLAALKKGDRVVTSTGMHGVIHEVRGEELVIEIADRVRVVFDRSAVKQRTDDKTEEEG